MRQREMSWYMLLFLFEGVAEECAAPRRMGAAAGPGCATPSTSSATSPTSSRPGALTAALNYYRANLPVEVLGASPTPPRCRRSSCPVLGVWSDLRRRLRRGADARLREARGRDRGATTAIEGAGHWIPLDAPDELNALLVDYLR